MEGKKIVFAGAAPEGAGTPWGTLALVTRKALAPLGYETHIEIRSWGANNPRYVADGRADLGATQYRGVREAWEGIEGWSGEGPRDNLRLIATINQPAWLAVGVRAESGITDLADIARNQMPVRMHARFEKAIQTIMAYYGLSTAKIREWGGQLVGVEEAPARDARQEEEPADSYSRWLGRDWNAITPWVAKGEFDLIIAPIYAANTPEHKFWMEACILHKMRFLPLPQDLIDDIVAKDQAEAPGFIPHRLYRGVDADVPTVERFPQVIYTRAEAPDDFIFEVTRALSEGRHHFRNTHMPYSYDPMTVCKPRAVPLHPAAERYYKEAGYL